MRLRGIIMHISLNFWAGFRILALFTHKAFWELSATDEEENAHLSEM